MTRLIAFCLFVFASVSASAEQFKEFDGIEVHYILVNTLFLQPDVAAKYGVVRANDRAIVNLSVLGKDGAAVAGEVTGTMTNLLSQTAPLQFSVINEGDSIYYVAPLRYTDQDVLRFKVTVTVPDRAPMTVEFQQLMYLGIAP